MMKLVFFLGFMMLFCNLFSWYILVVSLLFFFFEVLSKCYISTYYCNLVYNMGFDILSLSLVFLSVWIIILMIISSINIFKNNFFMKEFLYVNMFLLFFLFLCFSTNNLFKYYLFFECSLIPTILMIFGWGYQPERLSAGYYLLFYTLVFSLPMLLGIFHIYSSCYTLNFFLIYMNQDVFLYLSMLMAFMVKMPLIFVHFWLPKAHVEAPISGSMILAGVLLKLGGYGILRVFNFLSLNYFNYLFVGLSLYGMYMVGLLCLFQLDMKSLIAYSSVSHMGMVICGLMTMNYWGFIGSLILMLSHGLCSSGMFCLANIVYERSGSRLLFMNKGMINFMPSLCLFWFMFCANNMGSPPSLNLLGELFLINGILSWSDLTMVFLMFSSFIGCVYSIYIYSFVNHGSIYSGYTSSYMVYFIEYLYLFMHLLPLNMMFLKFDLFSMFMY
uniref:NADH-ubiquinone oxidoreductase chain 4 n=1 Tax=Leucophoroptera quadrimaculata TaxID=981277 RepID=A0A514LQJ1_9HEMI|nr:NADH dehydrogenase subunit 4 [Leucophoroptera quadrimaculata]